MRLAELNQISGDGKSGIRIGASVTLTTSVEHPIINRDYPVVAHAAKNNLDTDTPQHGNHRWKSCARHSLQLLRPELRVAQRHQLLFEERRRRLLGSAGKFKVLGGAIIRSGSGDGGYRREVALCLHAG